MIEPMKKVTVVCLTDDRLRTVERLRELGIVHVRDVQTPSSRELDALGEERDRLDRAIRILKAQTESGQAPLPAAINEMTVENVADEVLQAAAEISRTEERLTHFRRMHEHQEPWGSFARQNLEDLKARGLQVKFGVARMDSLPVVAAPGVLQVISRRGKLVHFVAVAPPDVSLDFEEVHPAEITSLETLEERIAECRQRVAEQRERIERLTVFLPAVQERHEEVVEEAAFFRARDGMGERGAVCYLEGYMPERESAILTETGKTEGWAVITRLPHGDDPDVPTLVTLPKWVEPIRLVFRGLGIIPGYREIDISAWFLLFFSLFFAMLIGDAGYGALMLIATVLLRKKYSAAPAQPFWLFGILAVSTIIWGVLTGVYFGLQLEVLPRAVVPALTDKEFVMRLCFLLGTVHLSLAHAWNAMIFGRSLKAAGELGWVSILWGNYFLAGNLVLGSVLPPVAIWLYGAGITAVVLFSAPQRNLFKMVGAGVGTLLLGIINSFVDVVSYVRLFAVGAASLAVEQSFNSMAFGLDWPLPLTALGATLILVFGHGLNMVLGAMGVLVHGIRLNVLEFSGHLGMQWSGVQYAPLAKREPKVR